MATLYLTEQGSTLRKEHNRLVVERDGAVRAEIHDFKVERVVIVGNVQLTTHAIGFLLDRGIDTAFLTTHGKLRGRLAPLESKNAPLRALQFARSADAAFAQRTASAIVSGKVANSREVLSRYNRNHPEAKLDGEISALDTYGRRVVRAASLDSLRGIEGQCAAVYFRGFGRMLRRGLDFTKRTRRPPTDPVNAMLSFGYTLLYGEAIGALAAVGFDPYCGFYHTIDYGRCSLALDLIEELRPVAIDRLVVSVANLQVLTESDFEWTADAGVRFSETARKRFLSEYERAMNAEFQHKRTGIRTTIRAALHGQAQALQKAVQDRGAYAPFDGWR